MKPTLIAVLLCVAGLVLPPAHGQQNKATSKQFLETKARADQGDPWAQNDMGVCYFEGRGVKKDAAEAVKWFRLAADQKLESAQGALGDAYANGQGVKADHAEAVKWYRLAAEQNDAGAQSNLGVHYLAGQGVAKDEAEAVKWFRKAAEQNLADAQVNLGVAYWEGLGVPKDQVEAYAWFNLAAKANKLANEPRDEVAKKLSPAELARARKRTLELATQTEATASEWQNRLGRAEGERRAYFMAKARNPAFAAQAQTQAQTVEARRKELRTKADQGDARAQWELGQAYSVGAPLDMKDDPQAVEWFRKAAAQDFVPALDSLAYFHTMGYGVARDEAEALKWRLKAAAMNSTGSQWSLGFSYRDGKGVAKDPVEAYAWFDLAARTVRDAPKVRDELAGKMTSEQVAAGKKRAEELRAQIAAKQNGSGK